MPINEEKPVSGPCNIATHRAPAGHLDRHLTRLAVARHVRHFHRAILPQRGGDDTHLRIDAMSAHADPAHVRQGHGQADGAVDAHVEGGDVVEKNYPARAVWLVGFAEQGTDHRLVAAGARVGSPSVWESMTRRMAWLIAVSLYNPNV